MIENEKKRIEMITQLTTAIKENNNIESQKIAAFQECTDVQRERNRLFEIFVEKSCR